MVNTKLYRGTVEFGEILMGPDLDLYLKNYPHRRGCNVTVGEMMMEIATFYRDAKGWIIRPGKEK